MAQFYVSAADSDPLSKFTQIFGGSITLQIVDDNGETAIYGGGSYSDIRAWKFTDAPSSADMEVVLRGRTDATSSDSPWLGPFGRINETNSTGYAASLAQAQLAELLRIDGADSDVRIAQINTGAANDVYHWARIRISGDQIKHRWWTGTPADEPAAWDSEVTDATYAGSGLAGFIRHHQQMWITDYGVGTGGDSAPTSPVGGGADVTVTEGAQGTDAWLATATVPGAVSESAQAGDTLSSVAVVGMALTEAVAAQDSDAGPAQALGAVVEVSTGNDLADAVAQISAAITTGASAGESWVADAQAVVTLIESGAAGDTITQGADSAEQAAVSEGSIAGEAFAAAVSAVASLTGASTAADALVAALVAMGSITHAASASDTHSAVGQVMAALTEVIDAGALYTASATVAQSIAEAIQAGDTWSAVVPGTDYLVASAITITAALSGRIDLEAALSGSASLDPAVSGSIKIKPD